MPQKNFLTKKMNNRESDSNLNEVKTDVKVIADFYQPELEKPQKKNKINFWIFLFLTIIFSFLISLIVVFMFISGSFYDSKIFSWLKLEPSNSSGIVIEKRETYNISSEEQLSDILNQISPASVGIFQDLKDKNVYYQNKNFVASGLILTSDGWVVTAKKSLNLSNNYVVIDQNGKKYKILETKTDDTWDIIYLKIDGKNLPVVSICDFKNVNFGDNLVLIGGISGINKKIMTNRIANNHLLLNEAYVWETEKNYLFFELENSNVDQLFVGSGVVNYKKEIVGIVLNNGSKNYLLPASYLKKHFNMLLTLKKYIPAYLGLEYIDLNTNLSLNDSSYRGVLVQNIKNNSPLYKTPIVKGTVILKVNDELINVNNNFSNLIQDYRIGDRISLTYLDVNKQEKTIEVELQ